MLTDVVCTTVEYIRGGGPTRRGVGHRGVSTARLRGAAAAAARRGVQDRRRYIRTRLAMFASEEREGIASLCRRARGRSGAGRRRREPRWLRSSPHG